MGRDRQGSHLDLGQNSNYGDTDTKGEVEANENLALIAGTRLGVVDEQQRHGRDRPRVDEEGEEEEAWEGTDDIGDSPTTITVVHGYRSLTPMLIQFTFHRSGAGCQMSN